MEIFLLYFHKYRFPVFFLGKGFNYSLFYLYFGNLIFLSVVETCSSSVIRLLMDLVFLFEKSVGLLYWILLSFVDFFKEFFKLSLDE